MKKNNVKLSLSIIAGREQNNLNRLVDTINKLKQLPDEIIIVFDMNQLDSVPSVDIESNTPILKLIEYHGTGKQPHMRNVALSKTTCDYIWFIDDDTSLHFDSCSQLYNTLQYISSEPKIASIAGRIIENKSFDVNKLKKPIYFDMIKGPVGLFELKEDIFPYGQYDNFIMNGNKKYPKIDFCQGTSMVFLVDKIKEVGGFDESLGVGYSSFEDSEPAFALKKHGYSTVYDPSFELIHHKLPRIGGVERTNQQISYNKYLVRNCTISLVNNNFPTPRRKYIYIYFFCVVQSLRCIKENIPGQKRKVKLMFNITRSIFSGMIDGFNVAKKNKYKRVNTSEM